MRIAHTASRGRMVMRERERPRQHISHTRTLERLHSRAWGRSKVLGRVIRVDEAVWGGCSEVMFQPHWAFRAQWWFGIISAILTVAAISLFFFGGGNWSSDQAPIGCLGGLIFICFAIANGISQQEMSARHEECRRLLRVANVGDFHDLRIIPEGGRMRRTLPQEGVFIAYRGQRLKIN